MNQPPIFLAIRAIGSEFVRRIYLPVTLIASGGLVVILGVLIWLVTLSGWWWFALAPFILISILFTCLAIIAGFLVRLLRPVQTKEQSKLVRSFVSSLQSTSEAIQTPKFILLFRLIKDVLRPSEQGFVKELSTRMGSLKPDFQKIIDSFR